MTMTYHLTVRTLGNPKYTNPIHIESEGAGVLVELHTTTRRVRLYRARSAVGAAFVTALTAIPNLFAVVKLPY